MATVASDAFTNEDVDTDLASHTPNVGTGWTVEVANSYTVLAVDDQVEHQNAAIEMAREGTSVGDDDMKVSLDVSTPSGSARISGVCGRMTTADFSNALQAYQQGDGTPDNADINLFKEIATVRTSLGTAKKGAQPTVVQTLMLDILTATKKVLMNGVEKISSSDDDAGLIGNFFAGLIANGSGNNSNRGDNFLSESVIGATQFMAVVNPFFNSGGFIGRMVT